MPREALFRWIEEAEARQILELALLQKTASDPYIAVAYAAPVSAQIWLRSLRDHAGGFNGQRSALAARPRLRCQGDGQPAGGPAPLRHTKLEDAIRDLGIEVDDAPSISEVVEL